MRTPYALAMALPLVACGSRSVATTLSIGVPYEIGTLDPHVEDKIASQSLLSNSYEALVALDADMKVRPSLAVSWESPDGVTWLFRLRPSVTFHGGRPLRVEDVVWSLQRVMERKDLEMRNYLRHVVEVSRVDERTVRIRTDHPTWVLLNRLSWVPVVPEGSSDEALRRSGSGTGPYAIAEWKRGQSLHLRRYEGYWGARPSFADVYFLLDLSAEETMAGIAARRHQLVQCDSKKAAAAFGSSTHYTVVRRDNLFIKYLAFDVSRDATPFCKVRPNPFKDRRVRSAVDAAVDRHRLVREQWRYAVPVAQPVPRSVLGFDPGIPERAYDPDEARALLREAGLPRGFRVTLHARKILAEAAPLLKEDLGRIGIDVDVTVLPDAEFFALVGNRGASFWINRFGCLSGDATELLEDLVHSGDEAHPYGIINYGGHRDPDLDRAIEATAAIDKPEGRRNAVQAILRRIMSDLIVVPLFGDQDVYVLDRTLSWEPRADSAIRAAEISVR